MPDPGYWHINSPVLSMPDASTGLYTEEYEGGVPVRGWHESNTVHHNGAFARAPGRWPSGTRWA